MAQVESKPEAKKKTSLQVFQSGINAQEAGINCKLHVTARWGQLRHFEHKKRNIVLILHTHFLRAITLMYTDLHSASKALTHASVHN